MEPVIPRFEASGALDLLWSQCVSGASALEASARRGIGCSLAVAGSGATASSGSHRSTRGRTSCVAGAGASSQIAAPETRRADRRDGAMHQRLRDVRRPAAASLAHEGRRRAGSRRAPRVSLAFEPRARRGHAVHWVVGEGDSSAHLARGTMLSPGTDHVGAGCRVGESRRDRAAASAGQRRAPDRPSGEHTCTSGRARTGAHLR